MKDLIEQRLKTLVSDTDEPLFQAVRYSLLHPGKRLRPLLVLQATTAWGGDVEKALDPACAIEMVHTYSLIHDDLPCMDDDDLRRGRPTLHKAFDEAIALLAGDYLLTQAFSVIAQAPTLTTEQRLQLVQILSRQAAAPGLIGGQAIDIGAKGKELPEEALLVMHRGKTGALFAACLQFGATVALAHPPLPLLQSLGEEMGVIYQCLDDLKDATSTTEMLGKTVGADAARNKPTAASLYGIEEARQKYAKRRKDLFKKIEILFPLKSSILDFFKTLFPSLF